MFLRGLKKKMKKLLYDLGTLSSESFTSCFTKSDTEEMCFNDFIGNMKSTLYPVSNRGIVFIDKIQIFPAYFYDKR